MQVCPLGQLRPGSPHCSPLSRRPSPQYGRLELLDERELEDEVRLEELLLESDELEDLEELVADDVAELLLEEFELVVLLELLDDAEDVLELRLVDDCTEMRLLDEELHEHCLQVGGGGVLPGSGPDCIVF